MRIEARMLIRAAVIACIVGPILITINQGAEVLAGGGISYIKAGLTMVVPFAVSLTSSWLASREAGTVVAPAGGDALFRHVAEILGKIHSNAARVNEASRQRMQALENVARMVRRLRTAADGRNGGNQAGSVEKIVEALDAMLKQSDIAVEGSAKNMRLARDGAGTLKKGRVSASTA